MRIHRAPLEPTSQVAPCCGRNLADLASAGETVTRVDREVTCTPNELADLGLSPVLEALVNAVTGRSRERLVARLREIQTATQDDDVNFRHAANDLLRSAGLSGELASAVQIPHGEPGHSCVNPEALMLIQDVLGKIVEILAGHEKALKDQGYPDEMVKHMVANLHAILIQRMIQ